VRGLPVRAGHIRVCVRARVCVYARVRACLFTPCLFSTPLAVNSVWAGAGSDGGGSRQRPCLPPPALTSPTQSYIEIKDSDEEESEQSEEEEASEFCSADADE